MRKRSRATWITYRETRIWCCDFSSFGSDHQSVRAEIEISDATIREQPEASLLVAVDLCQAELTPEVAAFFETNAKRAKNPIRKMAILGPSEFQRCWGWLVKQVTWPKTAKFFDDYEIAKQWLVREDFG